MSLHRPSSVTATSLAALALATASLGACAPAKPTTDDPSTATTAGSRRGGDASLSMSAEIGALDEAEVAAKFNRQQSAMLACVVEGRTRVPFLSGSARVAWRVKSDGRVRWAYLKESTLGDRAVEKCILDVMKSTTWPRPQGGEEGLAQSSFSVDDPDERMPVAWGAERVSKKPSIAGCGASGVRATVYVDTDGSVLAAGLSGSDETVEAAADCVLQKVRATKFPSPGSFAAKVTLPLD
jgi:hypothetical protein